MNRTKTVSKRLCPRSSCSHLERYLRRGTLFGLYVRKSDGSKIKRYRCQACKRTFSSATSNACFGQRKRHLNSQIDKLLCSGTSIRRISFLLGAHTDTVMKKMRFLSNQAALDQRALLKDKQGSIAKLQFDEMETFEHTKCKPLSIALAVEEDKRVILGFEVSCMPANGPLAAISRKKYGKRADLRTEGLKRLFKKISSTIAPRVCFKSDRKSTYPRIVKQSFTHIEHKTHVTTKGRRGCIVGQGELKKGGFDPLFSLNHTAAMIRANMARMMRKTWCTTKKISGLIHHLNLYVRYHNRVLIQKG